MAESGRWPVQPIMGSLRASIILMHSRVAAHVLCNFADDLDLPKLELRARSIHGPASPFTCALPRPPVGALDRLGASASQ